MWRFYVHQDVHALPMQQSLTHVEAHFENGRFIDDHWEQTVDIEPGDVAGSVKESIKPGFKTILSVDFKWEQIPDEAKLIQVWAVPGSPIYNTHKVVQYIKERIALRQGQINFIDTFGGHRSAERPKYMDMLGELQTVLHLLVCNNE